MMASSKIYQQMLKAEGECLDPCLVSNYLPKIPQQKIYKGERAKCVMENPNRERAS